MRFSFKLVMVGRTGAYAHSAKQLEKSYCKDTRIGFGLHVATEAFVGVSMSVEDFSEEIYTFMLQKTFLEFIKVEDMEQSQPKTFLLSEVTILYYHHSRKYTAYLVLKGLLK